MVPFDAGNSWPLCMKSVLTGKQYIDAVIHKTRSISWNVSEAEAGRFVTEQVLPHQKGVSLIIELSIRKSSLEDVNCLKQLKAEPHPPPPFGINQPAWVGNVHKMVLWMGLSICMVTSKEVDLCVCVCVCARVLGSLDANKKLKAHLHSVIPTTQLDFFTLTGVAAKGCTTCASPCDRNKNRSVSPCKRDTHRVCACLFSYKNVQTFRMAVIVTSQTSVCLKASVTHSSLNVVLFNLVLL